MFPEVKDISLLCLYAETSDANATSNEGVKTAYTTSETTNQNETNEGTSGLNEKIVLPLKVVKKTK